MASSFRPTTPPNTPERFAEVEAWMAREAQAATDKLLLALHETGEKAREFRESIRLIESAFGNRT